MGKQKQPQTMDSNPAVTAVIDSLENGDGEKNEPLGPTSAPSAVVKLRSGTVREDY